MGLFWMIFSEICFFVCIQACRKKFLETCLILVSNFWTSRRGEDHWWGSINLSCPKNAYLIFVNLEPVISCNWIYTQKNQKVPSTSSLYSSLFTCHPSPLTSLLILMMKLIWQWILKHFIQINRLLTLITNKCCIIIKKVPSAQWYRWFYKKNFDVELIFQRSGSFLSMGPVEKDLSCEWDSQSIVK